MNEGKTRALVAERSGGFCEARIGVGGVCTAMGQSMHHRRKQGQGGLWEPSNIVHVCGDGTRGCHGFIEANPVAAMRRGLWLRLGHRDPIKAPVQLSFRGLTGWWLLDDHGNITWLSTRGLELAHAS